MPNPSWCRILCRRGAALVIARRALGFPERMTVELKRKVAAVKEKLILKVDSLPGEGRGMTRIWSDLKELALASR